ncbi:hypothetical protein SAMN04490180_2768 [Pseudomonas brassicacearum]|nr:hypothetical protein SAMN04490180_2768 [Pseudomonas brassicacearum]
MFKRMFPRVVTEAAQSGCGLLNDARRKKAWL